MKIITKLLGWLLPLPLCLILLTLPAKQLIAQSYMYWTDTLIVEPKVLGDGAYEFYSPFGKVVAALHHQTEDADSLYISFLERESFVDRSVTGEKPLTGGILFQLVDSLGMPFSDTVGIPAGQVFATIKIDTVGIKNGMRLYMSAYDSLDGYWFFDELQPVMIIHKRTSQDKLITPKPSVFIADAKLLVEGNFDPRSGSYQLAILNYPSLPVNRWTTTKGFINPDLFFTVPDSGQLNNIQYTAESWVTVRSIGTGGATGKINSNWSYPVRISLLPSYPLRQASIVSTTTKEDSTVITVSLDARVTDGTLVRIVVVPDNGSGSSAVLADSVSPFVGKLDTYNKVLPIDTSINDSTGIYTIGPLDTATNYIITIRYSDPTIANGQPSAYMLPYPISTSGSSIMQNPLIAPEECEIVREDTLRLRFEGNQYLSLVIEIDSMTPSGNWGAIVNQTFTPSSADWRQVDGDVYISIPTVAFANSYRVSIDGGVSYREFTYEKAGLQSTCPTFSLLQNLPAPTLLYTGDTATLTCDVLGDTSTATKYIMLEVSKISDPTYILRRYPAVNQGDSAYQLVLPVMDSGVYRISFLDTVSRTVSDPQLLVVLQDPCMGNQQAVVFDSTLSHIGSPFANAGVWVQRPSNARMRGADSLAQSWIMNNGGCDSLLVAPVDMRILQIISGCPQRCDTTGTDQNCNSFGNYIIGQAIESGYFLRVANVNRILVQEGQLISRGDTLGLSGYTGESDGTLVSLYEMPDDRLDLSLLSSPSIARDFVMDATCPGRQTQLAMNQTIHALLDQGQVSATGVLKNTSGQIFLGTVQLLLYQNNSLRNGSTRVLATDTLDLAPGAIVTIAGIASNLGSSVVGEVALLYKPWNSEVWLPVTPTRQMTALGEEIYSNIAQVGTISPFLNTESIHLFTEESSWSAIVYPNPTKDLVTVELQGMDVASITDVTMTVHDIHGKVQQQITTTDMNSAVDITHLPAGVYILTIDVNEYKAADNGSGKNSKNTFSHHKIIKQ